LHDRLHHASAGSRIICRQPFDPDRWRADRRRWRASLGPDARNHSEGLRCPRQDGELRRPQGLFASMREATMSWIRFATIAILCLAGLHSQSLMAQEGDVVPKREIVYYGGQR